MSSEYKGKVIAAITSVPCFEIWYLLHVSDSRKPYENAGSPADSLIADLRKNELFRSYAKDDCAAFYNAIAPFRSIALSRARAFLSAASQEKSPEYHENPSTRVHLLIEALEQIAREPKS